ncbi:hypothetical protein ACHQM5_014616 [Ranunculus cassubicifolius]
MKFFLHHFVVVIVAFAFTILFMASVCTTMVSGFEGSDVSGTLERSVQKNRMRLIGSSPPTCQFKCGTCIPCRPVLVPVKPGGRSNVPDTECYPLVWRCICQGKLYRP